MNTKKLQAFFERYHRTLVPDYNAYCLAYGISDPPSVFWFSLVSPDGQPKMGARVLWNATEENIESFRDAIDVLDVMRNPGPDDVIAHPKELARRVSSLVAARLAPRN